MIAYLKLVRLPLIFTAIADSAAGYGLAATAPSWSVFAALAGASGGLYCFGMAMNDVADRERDRTLAPGRPLPSGRISLRGALLACVFLLAGSAASLAAAGGPPARWVVWGAALAAILAYDFGLKLPPVMGLVRGLNVAIGLSAAMPLEQLGESRLIIVAAVSVLYGTGLTFVSTLEEGQTGGLRLWAGTAAMLLGALSPAILHPASLVPGGLLAAWVLLRALRAKDRKSIMLMVRDGVAGFILLDAALVAPLGWVAPALIASLLVPAFLLLQLFKRLA